MLVELRYRFTFPQTDIKRVHHRRRGAPRPTCSTSNARTRSVVRPLLQRGSSPITTKCPCPSTTIARRFVRCSTPAAEAPCGLASHALQRNDD
jgi:hypothetical protein